MRDDIHRRLPLPRPWRRVVKACTRDAEVALRSPLLIQAAYTELRRLRSTFLDEVRRALMMSEQALFPADAFQPKCAPLSAIESSFLRECTAVAGAGLPAADAVVHALERALSERVTAVGREIRAQLGLDSPRDCAELVSRFRDATHVADLLGLARRYISSDSMPHPLRLELDLDSDLRGQR